MKLSRWVACSTLGIITVGVAVVATAGDGDPVYKPTLKYRTVGDPTLHETEAAACQSSVVQLGKTGIKHTYVNTKPGTGGDFSVTCILRDSAGKQWDQPNNVTIVSQCQEAGVNSTSSDKSGSLASQVCPCDPVKGCPVTPSTGSAAPPARPPLVRSPCAKFANTRACTSKKSPPGVDRTPRCTQQPKPKQRTTPAAAAKQSEQNQLDAGRKMAMVSRYEDEKRAIAKQELEKKRKKFGRKIKNGFPEFADEDMCAGINDVNIGTLCGTDHADFAAANNVSGRGGTPPGCTWHHHEDLGRMQLVKTRAHGMPDASHWGGRSIWTRANKLDDYPMCCP